MKKNSRHKYATLLESAKFRRMEWKNGGGSTSEIAIEPPEATFEKGDFLWRLSNAEVRAPGPFSLFPGYDRLLALIDPDKELELRFARSGKTKLLKPGDVLRFSGDEETQAEIPKGALRDLGLIYRRGAVNAEMSLLKFADKPRSFRLDAPVVFFYVIAGDFSASTYPGELNFRLDEGDVLRVGELGPAPGSERLILIEPKEPGGLIAGIEIRA